MEEKELYIITFVGPRMESQERSAEFMARLAKMFNTTNVVPATRDGDFETYVVQTYELSFIQVRDELSSFCNEFGFQASLTILRVEGNRAKGKLDAFGTYPHFLN